jgi:hypothetical protein
MVRASGWQYAMPAVLNPAARQCQEIFVVCYENPMFVEGECQLTFVGRLEQAGVVRGFFCKALAGWVYLE